MTECLVLFLFKQKTAYEMRISDWSSDVCSSDLDLAGAVLGEVEAQQPGAAAHDAGQFLGVVELQPERDAEPLAQRRRDQSRPGGRRSEERRGGTGWVSPFRSRWTPYHSKNKRKTEAR